MAVTQHPHLQVRPPQHTAQQSSAGTSRSPLDELQRQLVETKRAFIAAGIDGHVAQKVAASYHTIITHLINAPETSTATSGLFELWLKSAKRIDEVVKQSSLEAQGVSGNLAKTQEIQKLMVEELRTVGDILTIGEYPYFLPKVSRHPVVYAKIEDFLSTNPQLGVVTPIELKLATSEYFQEVLLQYRAKALQGRRATVPTDNDPQPRLSQKPGIERESVATQGVNKLIESLDALSRITPGLERDRETQRLRHDIRSLSPDELQRGHAVITHALSTSFFAGNTLSRERRGLILTLLNTFEYYAADRAVSLTSSGAHTSLAA